MISSTTASFRSRFQKLPGFVRKVAIEHYKLWRRDPYHPSLRFKKVGGRYWSIRIGRNYRALATREADQVSWFWIGPHDEYERLIDK